MNIFSIIIDWYLSNMNYFTITVLMAIESTFVPLPSELVLPPAAWLAAQGKMSLLLIILFSSIGCVLGATINYLLSYHLGRKIIYSLADSKVARIFFVNRHKVEKAENYFLQNGNTSTFIGRLLPGVRHLISVPAGLSKMNFKKFIFYTFLGSGIWNTILSLLGYYFGKNQDLLMQHFHQISYGAIAVGLVFVVYLAWKKFK
jgi:membrane protein DedA with SNARE-associated domain